MTLLAEIRKRELWPALLERFKSNDCHNPAGSPDGGQFCGDGESGGSGGSDDDHGSPRQGRDYSSTREVNAVPMYHYTSQAAADSIRQGTFRTSDNSMYGKGVYFTSSDDSPLGAATAKIEVQLDPHEQLIINKDTSTDAIYQHLIGVRAFDHRVPELMIASGIKSVRIKIEDTANEFYTVVFDPSIIKVQAVHAITPRRRAFKDGYKGSRRYMKAPISRQDIPALVRLSERLAPELRRRFLAAVAMLQGTIDLEALAKAIAANQLTAAEAAAKISTFPEVYGELAQPITSGFLVGSGLAIRNLADIGIHSSFTLINPQAVDYAKRATLDLVQPFKENAKETIRTYLAKAVSGETTASGAAKDIRDLIGLDPNRVKRADNFWRQLLEDGVPDKDIQRRVGRYMDALLRERAETIARNEIHKAAGAGQQAAWDSAARQGLIDRTEYSKVWVTTWDEALCDLCEPMDGQAVGMDEAFDTPQGAQDWPDMHVNCRCTANLVKTEDVADYVDSLSRPEEKPQSRR